MPRNARSLRASLTILQIVAMTVSFSVASAIFLSVRLPLIAESNQYKANQLAKDMATRVDILLDGLEARVQTINRLMPRINPLFASTVSDSFIGTNGFDAIYVISPNGEILSTGVAREKQVFRTNIYDANLDHNQLYQTALKTDTPIWRDDYRSLLDGSPTIALAISFGQQVVIAEIPRSYILQATRIAAGDITLSAWVLNSRGEMLVDTESGLLEDPRKQMQLPLVQTILAGGKLPETFTHNGKQYHPAVVRSPRMGWIFLARMPAGLDSPAVRVMWISLGGLLGGTFIISLLLAPWWAGRLARPMRALAGHAHDIVEDKAPERWPRGSVVELNQLSEDLEIMAGTLQQREQQFLAIFHETPIAIMVSNPLSGHVIIEVNDTWVQQFGHARDQVIGKTAQEIGLLLPATQENSQRTETHLNSKDGKELICLISSRKLSDARQPLTITVLEDVTRRRQIERELRDLTVELEQRVAQRTQALEQAHDNLVLTLDELRRMQDELVRSEKLAALGGLVAGIAHELNTPIGNGLMASSTMTDETRILQQKLTLGLRRSELETFIGNMTHAADITHRNLLRAAELVNSFKQVAVDQTSSQRRKFNLKAVIDEILLTLHPTLKRTPYQVEAEIPEYLWLDSYPGPLGQALTNLVNNSLVHAFEQRDHGQILIRAEALQEDFVRLTVSDDGVGITAELQERIFEPFFTTKMGRGGTGLGLHIVHNLVTHVLGGTITLESTPETGSCFVLQIPLRTPERANPNEE